MSSIVKIDGWTLSESKSLEVSSGKHVPTHETIKKTGTIDIYEGADAAEYIAVLKADLYCFSKGQDGTTKWTWRIPLGSGASCSSGKAQSPSLTYGGNPVVIDVTENQVTPAYNGDANYYGGDLYYGSFTVAPGGTCSAGELWLRLAYDYTEHAVLGTFGNTQSQTGWNSDGILSRNVLVATATPFTPAAEDEIGATSPRDSVTHGTWGVLPKDGPKLDSYCPKDSVTTFNSLEWTDREGDTVPDQCAQLYQFDQMETSSPDDEDDILVRRKDGEGAQLRYVPLSSLDISGYGTPPDADIPEVQLSSIQTHTVGGTDVLEIYRFHDTAYTTPYADVKDSGEFLLRDGNVLKYVPAIDLSGGGGGLSGDYWESGGDLSTCYGESIGDSSKAKVIDLDGKTLQGNWTTNGYHTVNQSLTVNQNVTVGNRLIIGNVQIYETVV